MLACAPEYLFGEAGELQGHAELAAEPIGKAQVLAREVHCETDVVAAVQDQLAFGFVHEAGTGAGLDGRERLREIEATALGQHERLPRCHEVDEGEHVGDDLDDAGLAQLAHVEDGAAHRL